MKALVLEAGDLTLREVPDPVVRRDDEVLIRIRASGICGTDLHILGGRYQARSGIILGHEATGVVLEVGHGVERLAPGDRVVLDPTFHCGSCFYCQSDRPNYCEEKGATETGVARDGTFAELHVARTAFLHRLPDDLTFEDGTLVEPLACVQHALSQTRRRVDSAVLVLGAGPIGLLFAVALTATGFEVTVAERAAYRVSQAKALFPAVRNLEEEPLTDRDGRFDLVVDTTGRMLETALPLVHRGGEVLLIGLDHTCEARIRPAYLTDNGIRLIGTIDTNRNFAPAISLLRRTPFFKRIVTHRLPLANYGTALELLGVDSTNCGRREPQANKIVLVP